MKLVVIGNTRHGKDTVCTMLRDLYGLSFISSSYFVAAKAVRPWLAERGIEYPDLDSCYTDRVNLRSEWFNAIADYNNNDPARLARELFAEHDIYCGLRNHREFAAAKKEKLFNACFWVDRSRHCPPEPTTSMTVPSAAADFIIDNNGNFNQLRRNVIRAYELAQNDGA